MRVLHVVGSLTRGGLETWLMNVLRNIDRSEIHMDFVVHMGAAGAYDDEAGSLGARVLFCPGFATPLVYAGNFKKLLQEYGPYDVVHSHVHHFSGFVLWLAKRAGVPGRIAHSHLGARDASAKTGLLRKGYLALMERLIRENATVRLACSKPAAAALFGAHWAEDEGVRLHYCSCDARPFQRKAERGATRRELGIPEEAFVVGHVGRFVPEKNHAFLLHIAEALVGIEPNAVFLLVGGGALSDQVEEGIERMGLASHVKRLGSRGDVPRLMQDAMDVFILPSLFEGLPVVCLEAQMAGLPMVLSDIVTEEADVLKNSIARLSLGAPPAAWAEALLAMRDRRVDAAQAVEAVSATPFGLATGLEELKRIYRESVSSGRLDGKAADFGAGFGMNRDANDSAGKAASARGGA